MKRFSTLLNKIAKSFPIPKLAKVIITSVLIGVFFLFLLPNPANAVMFILSLCIPVFYLVYRLYTASQK